MGLISRIRAQRQFVRAIIYEFLLLKNAFSGQKHQFDKENAGHSDNENRESRFDRRFAH